jgi:type I restriction enzyme S subunit
VIADLKAYPEYKESGVLWLHNVPKHWEMRKLKHVTRFMNGFPFKPGEWKASGIPIIRIQNLNGSDSFNYTSRENLPMEVLIQPGDLMFAWSGNRGTSFGPFLWNREFPAYLNQHIFKLVGHGLSNRYFYYVLRTATRHVEEQAGGIIGLVHVTKPVLGSVRVPLALSHERVGIVRFLDWANGRLERAIRAKRKVIALLGERKQAIIHRAVTRGLDPSVPLKPSGIPWLADIPQHWDTPLFGRLLARVEQGWSPVAAEGELALGQWAVLTLSAVRRGVFNPSAIKPVSLTANIPMEIEVGDGDVLLTRSNTRDRVGDVCIVRTPRAKTILCDLIYRLQVRAGSIVPEFLVYQLLSNVGRGQIERDARGSSGTMPKISQGHIKSWRILLPHMDEQKRIVENIDAESAPIATTISRLEREIELLREYRTRLVADVVTGKLDVREAAGKLHSMPDEAAEASDAMFDAPDDVDDVDAEELLSDV